MAQEPYWYRAMVSWVTWYLQQGESASDVRERWDARFAGYDSRIWDQAIGDADAAIDAAARAGRLADDQQLREALAGVDPPTSTTAVSAVVTYQDAAGRTYSRRLTIEARWDDAMSDVWDLIWAAADERSARYDDEPVDAYITSPLLYNRRTTANVTWAT